MCAFMPNLNEITKFRDELKNIAHEEEITARWGERVYDELPPPDPAEVPDIDLDALLPTDAEKPADTAGAAAESPKTEPVPEKRAEPVSDRFDTVPVTDAPDISADSPFPADFGNIGTENAARTETPPKNDEPSAKPDEPEVVSGDAYPVDEEGMPDTSDMDAFLSSFNFDDISGGDTDASDTAGSEPSEQTPDESGDSFGFDTDFDDNDFAADSGSLDTAPPDDAEPAANSSGADDSFNFDDMLSSFDFDPEPIKADQITPTDDDAAPEDVETLDEHDEVPVNDDMLAEERTIPDINIPDIDLSAFDSLSNGDVSDNSEDHGALDELEQMEDHPYPNAALNMDEDEETAQFPVSDEPAVSNASEDSAAGKDADASGNLENMDELSLFSENREEPGAVDSEASEEEPDTHSFEFSMEPPASDPIGIQPAPQIDAGFDGIGMPEHITDTFFTQQENDAGDQTGFALEENPLDSDITEVVDDQFNLPDNFKDFSADAHTRMFDSVIAKSTGSAEDNETLTISDDDYFRFLNKLESFPFNVQLAIQDYIANGDDRP